MTPLDHPKSFRRESQLNFRDIAEAVVIGIEAFVLLVLLFSF